MRWPVALLAATAFAVPHAGAVGAAPAIPAAIDSTRDSAAVQSTTDTAAASAESLTAPTPGAPTARAPTVIGDSLSAQLAPLEVAAAAMPATPRRVLEELIAAVRELAGEGDAEAAALVLEDARSLVERSQK